jgi:glutathione S-transferase
VVALSGGPDDMLLLHHMQASGNSYKVRLCARQLGVELALKNYPFGSGLTRTPAFLAKNPNARVPLLEFEDGSTLAESNAILWYLAEETTLVPPRQWDRAKCLEWMFFEQYSHEPYVAVARMIEKYLTGEERKKRQAEMPGLLAKGNHALLVMEAHLDRHDWFAGENYSIADIALYAYTHSADEGGFDLQQYPAIGRWLGRVRAQPKHIPISDSW